jgi:hypothetical protein
MWKTMMGEAAEILMMRLNPIGFGDKGIPFGSAS